MSNDERFERNLRETLNRQTIDRQTRDALQAARLAALDGKRPAGPNRWIPTSAYAATAFAALLLVVGAWLYPHLGDEGLPEVEVDDLVVITDEDELELFEELEFYVWFEQDQPV